MSFMILKNAVMQRMKMMEEHGLLTTDVDKDDMWDTYLSSFKPEDNPMFRKRTEHDCSCCRQFIKACGNVVAVIDGELVSIWDVNVTGTPYQVVVDAMSKLVKGNSIKSKFLYFQKHIGTDHNLEPVLNDDLTVDSILTWNHFHHELHPAYIAKKDDIPSAIGKHNSLVGVFRRALKEIDVHAIETVLDLISQNSLYRGEEFDANLTKFIRVKKRYDKLNIEAKELFVWDDFSHSVMGIRNSVIGTLLTDLSEGKELEYAVSAYESKVAPDNYKRPSALITKSMIDKAEKKVLELGITDSLQRRYAHIDDITINNVIFANRDAKVSMGIFDDLKSDVAVDTQNFDKVEEIGIDRFLADVLPTASSIQLMFENNHENNLVSLIAPVTESAPNILKWDNNFSWDYKGNVTDSMRDNVKKAGGNVEGVLRFSIQWNDGDDNKNDFDAHCKEPNGNLIYFANKREKHNSSGMLDTDIVNPGKNVAVENIIYTNINKMPHGKYQFLVHNYNHRGSRTGFTAEIEYNGIIHHYSYNKNVPNNVKIEVAEVGLDEFGFNITHKLDSEEMTKQHWNINTQNWQNVSMVTNSPNYWNGKHTGNKHWFFMLTDCINPDKARGFYNEFLSDLLHEDRKVFEVLGNKMKTDLSDNQLSGLGFSSTKRNSILCKVSGSFNRVVKIIF